MAINKNIRVSQATIDQIKKMGMTKALKAVGSTQNASFAEGVRRMYGDNRVIAATKNSASPYVKRESMAVQGPGIKPKYSVSTPKATSKKTTPSGAKPTSQQVAAAQARAGGSQSVYSAKVATPAKAAPKKPYVAPKATAQQIAQANARSGGSGAVKPKAKKATPLTAAQVAANKKTAASIRAAAKKTGRSA